MTALTIANAAADLRHLVDGIPGQLLLKDRLYAEAPRGLDRTLFHKLAVGDWIDRKQNLLVIGPTDPAL